MKRGDEFNLPWFKDVCIVIATRKGTLYFRSGDYKYQMPIEVYTKYVARDAAHKENNK
jgi:hypothetical protein